MAAVLIVTFALLLSCNAALGDEPVFKRAEIWHGSKRVSPPPAGGQAKFAEIYINGRKVDTSQPVTDADQPNTRPATSPARPATENSKPIVPPQRRGPLVLEFPLPKRLDSTQPRPGIPDNGGAVPMDAPNIVEGAVPVPSIANEQAWQNASPIAEVLTSESTSSIGASSIQPASLTIEEGVTAEPRRLTKPQPPSAQPMRPHLLPAARLIFSVADVQKTKLSPHVFFWPLVVGLLFLYFVRRGSFRLPGKHAD
jgi:hypothetical protein